MIERIRDLLRRRPAGEREQQRAQAAAWLEDETLNTALATLRHRTITAWSRAQTPELREECWRTLQTIQGFVAALRQLATPSGPAKR